MYGGAEAEDGDGRKAGPYSEWAADGDGGSYLKVRPNPSPIIGDVEMRARGCWDMVWISLVLEIHDVHLYLFIS